MNKLTPAEQRQLKYLLRKVNTPPTRRKVHKVRLARKPDYATLIALCIIAMFLFGIFARLVWG